MVSYRLLLISVALLTPVLARADELRTWTDVGGRKVEAKFVRIDNGEVVLDKAGTTVSVPVARFSAADQQYLRDKHGAALTAATPGDAAAKSSDGKTGNEKGKEKKEPRSKADVAAAELRRVRDWRNTAGKSIKARFERFFGQQVILVQGNKVHRVEFSLLSSADRDFLRQNFEAQGKGDQVPVYVAPATGPNGTGAGAGPNQIAGGPGVGVPGSSIPGSSFPGSGMGRPPFAQPNIPRMPDFDRAQEVLNRWADQSQNQNEQMRSHLDQARSRLEQMRAQAAANREQIAKSIRPPPATAPPSTSPAPSGYGQPSAGYGQPASEYAQPSGYGQPSGAIASASPATPATSSSGPLYTPPPFSSSSRAGSSNVGPRRDQVYNPLTGTDSSSQSHSFADPFAGSPNTQQYQEVIICSQCNKAQKPGFKAGQKCQHCGVRIDEITDEGGKVVERSVRSRGKQIKFWVWAAIAIISIIGGAIAKLKG